MNIYNKRIDSVYMINQISFLVQQVLPVAKTNRFYLTNVISTIVKDAFSIVKDHFRREVRILCCYEDCVEILQILYKNEKLFDNHQDLFNHFNNTLLAKYDDIS